MGLDFNERPTVVLLKTGPYAGHIAVIAEIIDHNRVGESLPFAWPGLT
jgi:ribosomal protein L14E/L6E/L27E